LIENTSEIFNLCRVNVGWWIVESHQCVVTIHLLDTSGSHVNNCIHWHRCKCVVDRGNDPSLEGIRLIKASNGAVDKESVCHA
jgi:hypothetical protein